jgi:hypothetical protein
VREVAEEGSVQRRAVELNEGLLAIGAGAPLMLIAVADVQDEKSRFRFVS